MPIGKPEIKIKIDYGDEKPQWIKIPFAKGSPCYITNDPEQKKHYFVGFKLIGENLIYILSYLGTEVESYDFEVSDTKGITEAISDENGDVEK